MGARPVVDPIGALDPRAPTAYALVRLTPVSCRWHLGAIARAGAGIVVDGTINGGSSMLAEEAVHLTEGVAADTLVRLHSTSTFSIRAPTRPAWVPLHSGAIVENVARRWRANQAAPPAIVVVGVEIDALGPAA
jgi:hypothetical protein